MVLSLAELHALWVLSTPQTWLEEQRSSSSSATVLPAFRGIWCYSGANTLRAIPQLFSTAPSQTSMFTERSHQIKAKAEQEGERRKNNLWWGLLNESIIPGRKLKPGLLWVVRNSSKPSGKTNTRMFCPYTEWLNVYKLIVYSWLTLIFHMILRSVCNTNSLLECHFWIVCKSLRQVTSAQTARSLVFLI